MTRSRCLAFLVASAVLLSTAVAASAYKTGGYTIWRVVGSASGSDSSSSDALTVGLGNPLGVAVDSHGNIFVNDSDANVIWKVTPSGASSTVVGTGAYCLTPTSACGDGGSASAALLGGAEGLATDAQDNLYIADKGDNRIRKVTPTGTITTVAGSGTACADPTQACGDAGPAGNAQLNLPTDVAVDGHGALYIADFDDHKIRRVSGGVITTIAGNGTPCAAPANVCGDGGAGTSAQLNQPAGVGVNAAGTNVFIADSADNRVREVTGGNITTVAGDGSSCAAPTGACGDGGSPTSAQLSSPYGVTVDSAGVVYVADRGDHKVRRLVPGTSIMTIAGNGNTCAAPPNCGDGGAAGSAQLSGPRRIALDRAGGMFVVDDNGREVRWLTGQQSGPAGARGPAGATGPAGQNGAPGANGTNGADGLNGAPGAAGKNGRDAVVTCKLVKVRKKQKVSCTVKLARASGAAVRVRIARGHTVYASAARHMHGRRASVRLRALRTVSAGRYSLTVVIRRGQARERVAERITL